MAKHKLMIYVPKRNIYLGGLPMTMIYRSLGCMMDTWYYNLEKIHIGHVLINRPRNLDPLSCQKFQKFHINQPPISSRHGTIVQRSDAIQPANPVGSWCKVLLQNTRKGALGNSHWSEDTRIASQMHIHFTVNLHKKWKSRLGSVVLGQRTLTVGLPSHLVLLKITICYHESLVSWTFHFSASHVQISFSGPSNTQK